MKILFLEDDPIIGNVVSEFLNESYEVTHCYNSNEALNFAENEKFDLYIFDINVPGISGLDLLKSLREFNDSTPAIFITAYRDIKYLKEGFNIGANDFIRKPFEVEELQARVENIRNLYSIDLDIKIDELNFYMGSPLQDVWFSIEEEVFPASHHVENWKSIQTIIHPFGQEMLDTELIEIFNNGSDYCDQNIAWEIIENIENIKI